MATRLTSDITIDGNKYTIQLLGGWNSLAAFSKISPLVAPAAGIVVDEMINNEAGYESQIFTSIATAISHSFAQPEVQEVSKLVLEGAYINGKTLDVDAVFKGDLSTLMKLLSFAFKENFLGFILEQLGNMGITTSLLSDFKEKWDLAIVKQQNQSEENVESQTTAE